MEKVPFHGFTAQDSEPSARNGSFWDVWGSVFPLAPPHSKARPEQMLDSLLSPKGSGSQSQPVPRAWKTGCKCPDPSHQSEVFRVLIIFPATQPCTGSGGCSGLSRPWPQVNSTVCRNQANTLQEATMGSPHAALRFTGRSLSPRGVKSWPRSHSQSTVNAWCLSQCS